MSKLVCKRLPANEETLRFLSPFFSLKHIQEGIDDRLKSYFGIYHMMRCIVNGFFRCYGVFELDDDGSVTRFMGFEMGELDETKECFESHAFWDRHTPTVECVNLCKDVMKEEFLNEGVDVKYSVGYIPDKNRAAQWMAKRAGYRNLGIRNDKLWCKDGVYHPCREFRINL